MEPLAAPLHAGFHARHAEPQQVGRFGLCKCAEVGVLEGLGLFWRQGAQQRSNTVGEREFGLCAVVVEGVEMQRGRLHGEGVDFGGVTLAAAVVVDEHRLRHPPQKT